MNEDAEQACLPNLPRWQIDQVIAVRPADQAVFAAHLLPIAFAREDVHLLPRPQLPDDVFGFDGGRAAHVEPIDISDDARRVVNEIHHCFLRGILSGNEAGGEQQEKGE